MKTLVATTTLIVGLCVGGLALGLNWRKVEARYWLWRAETTGAHLSGVAEVAADRGFILLRQATPEIKIGDSRLYVRIPYRCLVRDIFGHDIILISHDEGATWREKSTCDEDWTDYLAARRVYMYLDDPTWDAEFCRGAFSLRRREDERWVEVYRFTGYPDFEIIDLREPL